MMTRAYLRYALMAAALGFWLVLVSVGGMVGLYCLLGSLPRDSYFFVLLIGCIFMGGHYFPLIGVTELGSRLAAKAPLSCSVSAGLLPLLPAILALAFLPAELGRVPSPFSIPFEELRMLQYLRIGAGLLYALFLLAFCFSSHARKKTAGHGEEERPADASDTGTAAQASRRYLSAAVAVSICFLPFCALLGMLLLKGDLDAFFSLFVIIGLYFGILAACGCWLAARAQAAAVFIPGLKPLLLPTLLFFGLALPGVYLVFVGPVIPRSSAAWLIAAFLLTCVLFLLLFHAGAGARKRKKPSGGQQPASPHDSDSTAKEYRHYLITAGVMSVFFLLVCAALNLYAVDGFLFALCGSPFLVLSDDSPFVLKEVVEKLPFSGGILATVICCGLTVPAVCGSCLAARAQAAPTFSARYLPLLLPPLLFLSVLILCARASFDTIPLYKLMTLTFALTYGLFLLAFRFGNRKWEPAQGRRTGLPLLLLVLAPFCAALAVSLPAVLRNIVDGEEDAVKKPDYRHYEERFSPSRPDNGLALPAVPPSLRLAAHLPRLDGTPATLPLYAAAFQAVTCLDEDGRPLSAGERDKRLAGNGVSCSERYSLRQLNMSYEKADIFFGPPPSTRQLDWLSDRGLTPDVHPLAHEALVFFVHKDNPVRSLSSEQLRRIYTGEITNWKEVGGRDERILPFQHEEGDENQLMLEELILRGEEAVPPLREKYLLQPLTVDESMPRSMVARYRKRSNALGFGLRWYLDQWFPDGDFRLLAVDGVPPTDATLRDGNYPLSLPLCMISHRPLNDESYVFSYRPLSAEGRAFRDWLLGPEGRDLIRRAGYLPWNDGNDGENGGGSGDEKNFSPEP